MYFETLQQMKRMLGHLDRWIEKAASFAQSKAVDPKVFVAFRLAPDQFPFTRQVQIACDTPKLMASRLSGKPAPSHPDVEQDFEELRARIRSTLEYLDTFGPADFEGAATRTVTNPRWQGRVMSGADYFREHAVPNFHFHVVTAYAILRHNGVELGKADYLGPLSLRDP